MNEAKSRLIYNTWDWKLNDQSIPTNQPSSKSPNNLFDEFPDAEVLMTFNLNHETLKSEDWIDPQVEGSASYGWCGLDAINFGLSELQYVPIIKAEVLNTLSRTEDDICRDGMSVQDLETLLNMRSHSVMVMYGQGIFKLKDAKYKHSTVLVGHVGHHFIPTSQKLIKLI